jgi:hypothetical protein
MKNPAAACCEAGGGRGLEPIGMAANIEREREHLAKTDQRIAECKSLIAWQRELIRDLVERGQRTQSAEEALNVL